MRQTGTLAVAAAVVAAAVGVSPVAAVGDRAAAVGAPRVPAVGHRAGAVGAPRAAVPAAAGAGGLCALAKRQHLMPAADTCVNALSADVTGDGRADLVLLYDRTRPGPNQSVNFGPYTLKVVPAVGGVLESKVHTALPPAVIVAAGHVNDQPGVELFIQVQRISSGSGVAIYSDQGGRLVRSHVTLTYGGDSGGRFGFSCVRGPAPAIVQRSYVLLGPGILGRWRERIDTYRWNGPRLRHTGSRTMVHHGGPGAHEVGIGAGCGPLPGVVYQGSIQSFADA